MNIDYGGKDYDPRIGGELGGHVETGKSDTPKRHSTESGGWRPDAPFHNEGLKVTLHRIQGVTAPGLLRVPFRFQAPPIDRYGRAWNFDWPTSQTINAGEVARPGGRQLERPSFQTMLLDEHYRWMVWRGSFDVQRMLRELRHLLEHHIVFRLTVGQPGLWGPHPLTSLRAAFTSIQPEERGGEIGTEYTQVEFIQVPAQRIDRKARRRPRESDVERRWSYGTSDTLYHVALKAYGRKSAWGVIARVNGIEHVEPDDSPALLRWMRAHDRRTLRLPFIATTGDG